MSELKPIETVHSGYRFRSRLEARWAVFFEHLGISYEYESQGYDLGEVGRYLPDFWLPDFRVWLEVKPDYPTEDEEAKCRVLHGNGLHPVLIGVGQPYFGDLMAICHDVTDSSGGLGVWYECQWVCDLEGVLKIGIPNSRERHYMDADWQVREEFADLLNCCEHIAIEEAGLKARQARFEHGERA